MNHTTLRFRLYDWWGASLGMKSGRWSVVCCDGAYNPEDAHLIEVNSVRFEPNPPSWPLA